MSVSQIILVVASSLGVIHGIFLAIFLWLRKKGMRLSNQLLSLLLVILSFRVGKSVLLEFAEHLDVPIIFVGLGSIMAIGPLFYFFVLSRSRKSFQLKPLHYLHFVPLVIALGFGVWVNESFLTSASKITLILIFVTYYVHFLIYLITVRFQIGRMNKESEGNNLALFKLLLLGLSLIWLVYVLNLLDEFVPYVLGPILYTVIAYVISFVVIQKGWLDDGVKYKTTSVPEERMEDIFARIDQLVVAEEGYKKQDLTLKVLSASVHATPQVLSMVINKKSGLNFNAYINKYRIEQATKMLESSAFQNYTIAAIAFEVGFNSISSFNAAFKKNIGKTPIVYRQEYSK